MRDYVKAYWWILGLCMVWIGYISEFLFHYLSKEFALWIFFFLLLGLVLTFFLPFFYERKFFKKLEKLHEKDYVDGLNTLEVPRGYYGKIFQQKMEMLDKAYSEKLFAYEHDAKENEEYMILWTHEVKTPMAAIRLMLDNELEKFPEMEEELDLMEFYTDQALYYARAKSPREDYVLRKVCLEDMINQLLRNHAKRLIALKAGIVKENLNHPVYTDSKWLLFILEQVLNNALQYRKEEVMLSFIGETFEEYVLLRFRDNGKGIPKEDLSQVFRRGYTGKRGREGNRSTGMGLYLSHKLAEKLGMKIEIESKEGKYTESLLYLPREKRWIDKVS